MVAGIVTLTIGIVLRETNPTMWTEGASIMLAIVAIVSLTTWNETAKEKQILKLQDEIRDDDCTVIRGQDGLSNTSRISEIVVGDIISF
jgi:magnesium-transporting ATPase (P-type)